MKNSSQPHPGAGQIFSVAAHWVSNQMGRPPAFMLALVSVVIWAITGPYFHYSETWQLVINTGTTIITFLMVFLIQNSQNRDTQAIQLKLDELIFANHDARNAMLRLDEMSDKELSTVKKEFDKLAQDADEGPLKELAEQGQEIVSEVQTEKNEAPER